jgi:hypothetical protein
MIREIFENPKQRSIDGNPDGVLRTPIDDTGELGPASANGYARTEYIGGESLPFTRSLDM